MKERVTLTQHSAADAYMRRFRNADKRAYARQYWNYLTDFGVALIPPEPDRGRLSVMAAQAVRTQLRSIFNPLRTPSCNT
jgi:hypothetical protein